LPVYQSAPIDGTSRDSIPGACAPSTSTVTPAARQSVVSSRTGKTTAVGEVMWSKMARRVRALSRDDTAATTCATSSSGNGTVASTTHALARFATYPAALRTAA
jgi:hypothetical protein